MTDSWALKAIEREARDRVWEQIIKDPDNCGLMVFGLSVRQIRALKDFWENKTGMMAHQIFELSQTEALELARKREELNSTSMG